MKKYIFSVCAVLASVATYFVAKHQDTDLVLRAYETFGPEPCSVLKGKVIWITGASSGIGEQLAYDLAACGCKLVLSARRKTRLEEVKRKCGEIGLERDPSFDNDERVLVLPMDVTSFSSHVNLTNQVIEKFGQIDVLLNNAGVFQMVKNFEKIPIEVEKKLFDINLLGAISLSKAVIPHMTERKQGKIVLVGSILGKYVIPGLAAYCASKFGLMAYFDAMRYELYSHNIKILHVLPGPVVSNFLENAFTDTVNVTAKDLDGFQNYKNYFTSSFTYMETKRCTYLIMVAMGNNLKESWIAPMDTLVNTYISHYLRLI